MVYYFLFIALAFSVLIGVMKMVVMDIYDTKTGRLLYDHGYTKDEGWDGRLLEHWDCFGYRNDYRDGRDGMDWRWDGMGLGLHDLRIPPLRNCNLHCDTLAYLLHCTCSYYKK